MWKSSCMKEETVMMSTNSQHGNSSRASRLFYNSFHSNKSTGSFMSSPGIKTSTTKSRRKNPYRSFLIALLSLRNILALLVFIGLNLTTLIHDPLTTFGVIQKHLAMQFHHDKEQQLIPNFFCQDNGEKSVLCLRDEKGAYMMPTPKAIANKIKRQFFFKDETYGNVTYGTVLYENNLLMTGFHYDTSCNELIQKTLRNSWINNDSLSTSSLQKNFQQQCCTLTNPTAGMFWNLCTTPPDEVLTSEGRKGKIELRGPMMHATMGLIDQYYRFSGCRVEEFHSISYEEAKTKEMTNEEIAQINHLNCMQLELQFDLTDVSVLLGPIVLFFSLLMTTICRVLKLIKLFFLFFLTMKLNFFCFQRRLFFKTFSEDLMYSDIFIQKVNVLIGFFSLTTLTMHFGIWGVDHGMKGFFSSLHLITWGEGIYTIVIFSAKKIKVRITSVNSFVIILFGTRYLLTNFAKIGYHFVLSKSCIDAGITGNYNIDSTITILFALLTYALSTVMLQLIMSGMVQFCFKSFYFNPYNNNNKKNNTFNVVPYKLSRFEQMTGQNFSCVYGFAPVSHHQLLIKGVAYTPLEWVLTSGYFLYQGYLYETNLRTSLWFLTNKQIGCIQAIPIAEYINGTLQEIKQKVDDDDHVKNDTNAYNQMEIGMTKTEPKKCESNLSNTKGPFTSKTELYKPRNKAQEGFIFTPL